MPCYRVVQYTQTAANRQRQLTNRQTGSRFAAKWCCHTGDIVYNILKLNFRSFHALRTWKVYVVMFSYHATNFHPLLTCAPLDFRNVNARFDFRHTMVISHIAYAS